MNSRIVVHDFAMGDVADPEIYCAIFTEKWRETARAQWIEAHCKDLAIQRKPDPGTMGGRYEILAEFEEQTLTEYRLRFGQ